MINEYYNVYNNIVVLCYIIICLFTVSFNDVNSIDRFKCFNDFIEF